ncbi:hypothetical protein F511_37229 [Dorcoceras hygrometricum]|uniref:Uncharacterized protein n=1 Tax=Dorcoceras hygrometricum TaxID=472368 RepID=A0A2Z7CK25_9LAMI|nr:hypothetical protein F511_37229 [Dorcoceras hygrometricum]
MAQQQHAAAPSHRATSGRDVAQPVRITPPIKRAAGRPASATSADVDAAAPDLPRARGGQAPGVSRATARSDCGRYRQSGPRPDTRLLRHPALEGVTRSARTDSPRRIGRNEFPAKMAVVAAA